MPVDVVLSQWIGVGGWGIKRYNSVSLIIFAYFLFQNSAPNYSPADDAATNFSIVQRMKISPLRRMG